MTAVFLFGIIGQRMVECRLGLLRSPSALR
jgi:hypothetical protein